MAHTPDRIRNFALVGHGHAGKTALLDALAFHLKVTSRQGADGAGLGDYEPEERERRQTLAAHQFRLPFGETVANVFDTPGHPDFVGETIAALDAVETALFVVNAANSVTFHLQQLWRKAGELNLGRAIAITHLDQDSVDFHTVVDQLRAAFGHAVVPASYPNACGAQFRAVHDVTHREGPEAEKYHEMIEEDEAEGDDVLMEHYLETGHLDENEFTDNLRRAVARGNLVPVFAVCPNRGLGLEQLVEFVERHFPSPVCYGARRAAEAGSEVLSQVVDPEGSGFVAKVVRVVVDPFVGRLSVLRCLRGGLAKDQSVVCVRTGTSHKVAHLYTVHGKETKEVPAAVAGDLFAVGKIEDFQLGDTLTDGARIALPAPGFPVPTYSRHIWPKARGDEQKIAHAIEKVALEDPTFRHARDPETGEFLVTGMSPVHLEVQFQRLHRKHHVDVLQGPPTIPYRESITARADGHHRHKKQSGGRGQFAEVYLRVAPRERGDGHEFVDSVVGGAIPRQFLPEVEKGVRKFLARGALAGFPVVDVQVEVHDGKFHDVDSDQISFQIAGERALHDAFGKARPILLEPVMQVEIHVPDRFTGDVAGNLAGSRGRLAGMETQEGMQVISAQVPMAALLEYSTQLRSITAGEGSFTMRFSHYEPMPPHLQEDVVRQRKAIVDQHHAAH